LDERDEEKMIQQIAQSLRDEPIRKPGPSFDARVMAAIKWGDAGASRPSHIRAALRWFVQPRSVRFSPLSGLATAAALAAVAYLGAGAAIQSVMKGVQTQQQLAVVSGSQQPAATQMIQFVLVAPDARSVSLVGDFNDWNPKATPLSSASGNLWTVQIPLTPGRYNYIFMVDGARLVPDPTAPRAPADEFGQASSVVTIGSSTS
jgi:hypothetical protein